MIRNIFITMLFAVLTLPLMSSPNRLMPSTSPMPPAGYALIKKQLSTPDSTFRSRVVIRDTPQIESMSRRKIEAGVGQKVKVYRVRIFFDNSQNARGLAMNVEERFKELFPNIPVTMTHENPYFKVTVGKCLTEAEALIVWGTVKGDFDKAFIIREDMLISDLVEKKIPETAKSPEEIKEEQL